VVFAAVVLPEVTSPEAALTESDRKLWFPAVFSGVLTRRGSLECAHAQPEGGSRPFWGVFLFSIFIFICSFFFFHPFFIFFKKQQQQLRSLPVKAASGSTTWHHLRKYNLKTSYTQKRFGKFRRKL
jgi:hypothetical protein